MGQQNLMYRGIKINQELHFNKVRCVAGIHLFDLGMCTCVCDAVVQSHKKR